MLTFGIRHTLDYEKAWKINMVVLAVKDVPHCTTWLLFFRSRNENLGDAPGLKLTRCCSGWD